MKPWIRKAHRWLGLFFSLALLMSSSSGILHIIMTRSQSPPPAARPTGEGLKTESIQIQAHEATLKALSGQQATAINLRTIAGQPCYQIIGAHTAKPVYINANQGNLETTYDEIYAAEIAARFLGSNQLKQTDYLASYNREYIPIFRILPVYRFDMNDGLGTRVYVSTLTGSVTRHTDDAKQMEASLFSLLHKFVFIPNKNARDFILLGVTIGVFIASALGVILFFITRPRKRK